MGFPKGVKRDFEALAWDARARKALRSMRRKPRLAAAVWKQSSLRFD